MSYILDALKKSQRQRELGSVPRLTTEQLALLHRKGSNVVPWAVAAVAVATAAALAALYGPLGRPGPEADEKATAEAESSSPAPSMEVPRRTSRETAPEARHTEIPATDNTEVPAVTGRQDARAGTAAEMQSASASTMTTSVENGLMQAIPLLSDLSFDLQRSLPAPALNVHVYAQAPKDRFVFLDMRKYKEGERTQEGILIEEITPEGVILRYGQQRFRLVY